DSSSQVIIDMALNDSLTSIRLSALSLLANAQSDKYRKKWTAKVLAMTTADRDSHVRAGAYKALGEWKVSTAKQNMLSVLYDSSYSVAGNALEALNRIDKDTAYTLAKQLLKTNPKSTLESAIWTIIGKKGADEDIALYEQHAPFVLGGKRLTFSFSLSSYLKNVKSDTSFRRGVDIYAMFVTTENMKMYRSMLGGSLFQVASEQKGNVKSEKQEEAEAARNRLDIMKKCLQKIVSSESDTETKKDFEKSMKNTFE
ncbi:MAG: HEAT repeat domain-containing protein, partial [Chitinophagales bacterium]